MAPKAADKKLAPRKKLAPKKPSAGMKKPSAVKKKPAAVKKKPSAGKKKPSAGKKKPSAGKKKPSAGKKMLSAEKKMPSAGKKKPSAGKMKPSAGKMKPSACEKMIEKYNISITSYYRLDDPDDIESQREAMGAIKYMNDYYMPQVLEAYIRHKRNNPKKRFHYTYRSYYVPKKLGKKIITDCMKIGLKFPRSLVDYYTK